MPAAGGGLTPYGPTLVVGPTTGGVLLSFETARQLGGSTRAAFAEPVEGGRALRRGWAVAPDERVAIVDDILTTGASLLETVEAVRAAGVEPVAAAVLVDRSDRAGRAGRSRSTHWAGSRFRHGRRTPARCVPRACHSASRGAAEPRRRGLRGLIREHRRIYH